MSTTTTPPRPRYRPTPEECRRGGQAAAAKLTPEQRRAGGVCRSRQPSFRDLQRRRGRKGAAVVLARYGPRSLVEILAAYYRAHPTSLERFVHGVLRSFGVPFETQRVVEVTPGCRSGNAERGARNDGGVIQSPMHSAFALPRSAFGRPWPASATPIC